MHRHNNKAHKEYVKNEERMRREEELYWENLRKKHEEFEAKFTRNPWNEPFNPIAQTRLFMRRLIIAFAVVSLWKIMFRGPSKKGKSEIVVPKSLSYYLFTEQQIEAYMR